MLQVIVIMPMLVIVLTLTRAIYNAINLIIVQRSTAKTATHKPGYKATVTVLAFKEIFPVDALLVLKAEFNVSTPP